MALGKVRKAEKYKRNWKLLIGRALSLADSPLYAFYVGKRFRDDINVKSDVKRMMRANDANGALYNNAGEGI